MALTYKPLEDIEAADIQALVDNKVSERKTLDYKRSLPGNSDKDKKEFLADVSSFANAAGGHLIYGVKEEEGVPTEVIGVSSGNVDAEILRLESIVRHGIDPRLPGLSTHAIQLETGAHVVLIRVPRSWAQPHMVIYGGSSRFFSRNSRGKYQLDVRQIGAAFALSATTADRIRDFRLERVSMILSGGETPVRLDKPPYFVLHIVPLNAFDPAVKYDVSSLPRNIDLLPMGGLGYYYRHNFDGYLTFSRPGADILAYLQIFRNGIIESVRVSYEDLSTNPRLIPNQIFEKHVLEALPRFLSIQNRLGVEPPLIVMLNLLGVAGYALTQDALFLPGLGGHLIDRDALLIPETLVESFDCDPAAVMKDAFDAVWNAAGYDRCRNYDEEGRRSG